VVAGEIPAGHWVRRACRRQLDDLARWGGEGAPFRFDEARAGRVCRFVERLPHIKGPLAGQKLKLEPWQCFILTTVFGWVNAETGKRRFRRGYTEVPRGNGKSALSSGIGLYMLAADGEGGAEVYSAATTRDQARIVFRDAQHMARRTPELGAQLGVSVAAHNIHVARTASKFEALSAEGSTLDGLNIHCAIVDELHAHRTRAVYDVIETGTGKRPQSLLWVITTAGTDRSGICYELRTYCTKVLDGLVDDPSQFAVIYGLDDGDDWQAPASWSKANPNWGVSVMPDVVGQLATKAMQLPSAQPNFLTKHLNVWVNADSAWLPADAWGKRADPALSLADFEGQECVVALDLATKTDIASKVYLFRREVDGVTHYFLFGRHYLPEAALSDGRNASYAGWEIAGRLASTPGDVTDFGQVEAEVLEDASRFQVREVAYDPWQAADLAQRLQANGASVVEYRATVANFSAPMKELAALVLQGRLHHDGCPVMAWMVSNVVCHLDAKDNVYPRKERPENKIDGVVAAIMALGRWMAGEAPPPASPWDDPTFSLTAVS
jgi:phage terminase large subunit-like protein